MEPLYQPKIIDILCKSFLFDKESGSNKISPVILTFKGKKITLISGKCFWKNARFAKLALRHHIRCAFAIQNVYLDKLSVDKYLALMLDVIKIEPIK